ncbi:DnaJ family domain-containing protein [Saccharibacillus qingshengii]|uniref:DnaJ family domain-containing protein n=1 Tax=Saccharibacillus qingshengii TaxID=1763540 RepID=UPI001557A604|nr:DnaJ family domain-containing protein [Saccharibacillus qingshengii]
MGWLSWLAEQKIEEAVRRGEFDDLPGSGRPIVPEDLSGVPEELRVPYRILKNAGMLPEELQLRKECLELEDLLAVCASGGEKQTLESRLTAKKLKLRMVEEQRGWSGGAYEQYADKIRGRLEGS